MKKFLSWLPLHLAAISAVASLASNYVQHAISTHPAVSTVYYAVLTILAFLTPSPFQKAAAQSASGKTP